MQLSLSVHHQGRPDIPCLVGKIGEVLSLIGACHKRIIPQRDIRLIVGHINDI